MKGTVVLAVFELESSPAQGGGIQFNSGVGWT